MRNTDGRIPLGFVFVAGVSLCGVTLGFSGCAVGWKSARERGLETETEQLKGRVDALEGELARLQEEGAREIKRLTEEKVQAVRQTAQEKAQEGQELVEAQRRLAQSLKQELGDARAKLAMTERGLVLTFLDEIFFDSGKAVIKEEAYPTLKKVATVLKETVADSSVAVEGHTDNDPIKHSGWRSNWELSAARALAVVHYFTDNENLPPRRLRALAFGEFHPVVSNENPEGKRQNRRVEVVILPKVLKKEKPGGA